MAAEIGMPGGAHQAQKPPQRVAHQPGAVAMPLDLGCGEVGKLLHQMRPVAGDRVARIVAKLLQRAHRMAVGTQ